MIIKSILKKALNRAGYVICKNSPLLLNGQELKLLYEAAPWIKVWMNLTKQKRDIVLPFLALSKSQLGQDIFALSEILAASRPNRGFFVEIGASDGLRFSNTWLMEKCLGWDGILVEPSKIRYSSLTKNRTCKVDVRAVYEKTGLNLKFLDLHGDSEYAELSGLKDYSMNDDRGKIRNQKATEYDVTTIRLDDLLATYNAPFNIEFLSVDTEGSELQVIRSVDFEKYSFDVICIEHNFNTLIQEQIYSLIAPHGYKRVFQGASAWDDWYVLKR